MQPGRPAITRQKMVLMSLWVLANEESYRGVAVRFGLERGNCHRLFAHFCDQMVKRTAHYIKWPMGTSASIYIYIYLFLVTDLLLLLLNKQAITICPC